MCARACRMQVYGGLPPEARASQAALFNAPPGVLPRADVLVASDAVGLGLNLAIRRRVAAREWLFCDVLTVIAAACVAALRAAKLVRCAFCRLPRCAQPPL